MALRERIEILLFDGEVKPRLRGVSHAIAFVAALAGCAFLAMAPAQGMRHLAGIVFGVTLVLMFGVSAIYHCPNWSHATYQRLQRCDHAAIYVVIAGSFTPIAALDSAGGWGSQLLWVMWTAALTGAGLALMGHSGPRGLRSLLYVVLGLVSVPVMLRLPGIIGLARTGWLTFGGALYAVGAVIYARKWPNPLPSLFGYHEIFHLMVVAAASVHYAIILDVLRGG
ncbi:PAQR family membrane homeostasis protein TrhA [Melittangium boletus]|uniref:Channel protein, hemolysin III family n=1 Tax=Melittangium boletus DSM 14713 TaxID=1294270 RepID=A0A250IBQ6_9BACT|nr:hemolysin III family protein [Melittangium boletus]ATB28663.1 channel protein, hemolysin III family [Melittangium boletus DSM 14713]